MPSNKNVSYYLYLFSNFLAALGGGNILSRGMDILNVPYLKGGSIFAFLIGAVLGLGLLQLVPKKTSNIIAKWFSILCSLTSFSLLMVFQQYAIEGQLSNAPGVLFFSLLCLRFGFWFYSRVLRVSAAAAQQQSVGLIELGYAIGIVAGIVMWGTLGFGIGLSTILMVDIILQLCAGILDLSAHHITSRHLAHLKKNVTAIVDKSIISDEARKTNIILCGWLALSTMIVTISGQCIPFYLAHYFSVNFASSILATFYIGTSSAALFCKPLKICINWEIKPLRKVRLYFTFKNKKYSINILYLLAAFVVFIECLVIMLNYYSSSIERQYYLYSIFLSLVFLEAFCSEIFLIVILDRIGVEEKYSTNKNMIMRSYSLMAVGAAISFWIMGFFAGTLISLSSILLLCFIGLFYIIRKKWA